MCDLIEHFLKSFMTLNNEHICLHLYITLSDCSIYVGDDQLVGRVEEKHRELQLNIQLRANIPDGGGSQNLEPYYLSNK